MPRGVRDLAADRGMRSLNRAMDPAHGLDGALSFAVGYVGMDVMCCRRDLFGESKIVGSIVSISGGSLGTKAGANQLGKAQSRRWILWKVLRPWTAPNPVCWGGKPEAPGLLPGPGGIHSLGPGASHYECLFLVTESSSI